MEAIHKNCCIFATVRNDFHTHRWQKWFPKSFRYFKIFAHQFFAVTKTLQLYTSTMLIPQEKIALDFVDIQIILELLLLSLESL